MRGNLGIRDLRNICTGFLDPDLSQPYKKKKKIIGQSGNVNTDWIFDNKGMMVL